MKWIALLVLLILLTATQAASQVPEDRRLIVPGQRIGAWTLQMTVQDIVGALGRPTRILSGAQLISSLGIVGFQVDLRAYRWERIGLYAYTRDDRSIPLLEATGAPEFVTEKGVKWDMPRADVESAYGLPTRVTQRTTHPAEVTLQYNEIGLEVGFATTGRVGFIGVFRPGTASSIWKP